MGNQGGINWEYLFELVEQLQILLFTIAIVVGLILVITAGRRVKELGYVNYNANQGYTAGSTSMMFLAGVYFLYLPINLASLGQGVLDANGLSYVTKPNNASDVQYATATVRRLIQLIGIYAVYKGGHYFKMIGDNGLKSQNPEEMSPWGRFLGFTLAGIACIYHKEVLDGLTRIVPFNPFVALVENFN